MATVELNVTYRSPDPRYGIVSSIMEIDFDTLYAAVKTQLEEDYVLTPKA